MKKYDEFIELLEDWEKNYFLARNKDQYIQSNPKELPEEFREINWLFYSHFKYRIIFNPLMLKKFARIVGLDLDLRALFGKENIYADIEALNYLASYG